MENMTIIKKDEYKISDQAIFNALKEIGIPCNLLGYQYIKTAIHLLEKDETLIFTIVKGLYSEIAKIHNSTGQKVERAIRHAIEVGFEYGGTSLLDEIFGMAYNPNKGKPKNSEFIGNLYEYLKLNSN